ncbi:MAG: hypothetical protein PUC18_00600 [Prevotellaceae bacterium]|nr:hypothetical protein [Prevotellaceae bacterium]
MKEVRQIAAEYAVAQTNEVMSLAIAKAYADGYRDGYRDRDEEVSIDIRDNKTEYVDLGLPSGTLWASDYEKEDDKIMYLPYDKASTLSIPTEEQWNELLEMCKWESHGANYKFDCIGPNGNFITFNSIGYLTSNVKKEPNRIYFWIIDKEGDMNKKAIHMCYSHNGYGPYNEKREIRKQFSGYSLPVRLVGK